MFGTLHWDSHDKDARFVEKLLEPPNAKKYSACDRCRAKKVESAIAAGIKIEIYILTNMNNVCRSNAVPRTTIAVGASALERRALSVPRSVEAIRE